MATEFYHLTPSEKAGKIERKGIAANKHGEIFLFTNRIVANTIARDQVFTNRYTVFEINPDGITGTIIADKVSEFSASFQRIVKQDYLAPEFLTVVGEYETIYLWPTAWDYLSRGNLLGETKDDVDQFIERIRSEYKKKK